MFSNKNETENKTELKLKIKLIKFRLGIEIGC